MGSETAAESEAVVREFVDRLNAHDWDGLADRLASEFTVTMSGGEYGRAAFLDSERAFVAAFPDLSYTLEQCFAADGMAAFRWTFVGTHEGGEGPGVLGDLDPTGERVTGSSIHLARIKDRRIAELWAEWSALALYDQLGVLEFVTD